MALSTHNKRCNIAGEQRLCARAKSLAVALCEAAVGAALTGASDPAAGIADAANKAVIEALKVRLFILST
jgi:hypothetical protein